jgi:hypothetical protein
LKWGNLLRKFIASRSSLRGSSLRVHRCAVHRFAFIAARRVHRCAVHRCAFIAARSSLRGSSLRVHRCGFIAAGSSLRGLSLRSSSLVYPHLGIGQ